MFSISMLISEETRVMITKDTPYIMTIDSGYDIKVKRIQDIENRLTDEYIKTSRHCPPFCIQPTKIDPDIKNIEELEILSFMRNEVKDNTGLIIDARLKNLYEVETIPSSTNIPFNFFENAHKQQAVEVLKLLGMKVKDNSFDFSKAKKLAIFCNGVWSEQSAYFIKGLLKYNYPKKKLLYYRSGFQGWKLLGLTTVIHKEIRK